MKPGNLTVFFFGMQKVADRTAVQRTITALQEDSNTDTV